MTYELVWSQRSKKDLELLDRRLRSRIIAKVEDIKENPFAFVKRLKGMPLYSLRVGDYRIIMSIDGRMLIFVVKVGHRKDVYTKL